MLEVMEADCEDYADKVGRGGFYKWQEENKMFLNWAAEASTTMAYGVLAYNSMKNWRSSGKTNTSKEEDLGTPDTDKIFESASQAKKGGETVGGHALQKHAGRNPDIWGKVRGNSENINNTAMQHINDILNGGGKFNVVELTFILRKNASRW